MNKDNIEEWLQATGSVTPSEHFVERVMTQVKAIAASQNASLELAPLRFPWRRALPGLIAVLVALAAVVWHAFTQLTEPAEWLIVQQQFSTLAASSERFALHWILLTALISWGCALTASALVYRRRRTPVLLRQAANS